jgi:hypothetical protein
MIKKKLSLVIFCVINILSFLNSGAYSDDFGGKVLLLTIHVSKNTIQNGEVYKRKLTSDGRIVITPGLEVYYERDLGSDFLQIDGLRFTLGGYFDSIDHKSGYIAIMPRWEIPLRGKSEINLGLGPALIFRETWNTVPWYRDDGEFNESDKFLPGYQYKFIPGGDVGLHYEMSPTLEGVWSIVPGIPYVITQYLGINGSF